MSKKWRIWYKECFHNDKIRLQNKLMTLGVYKYEISNENDKLPIVQKYKGDSEEQYINKLKSYINDQNIKNAIEIEHPFNIINNLCEESADLLISIGKTKSFSVHDIPNENGKKKYNKAVNL